MAARDRTHCSILTIRQGMNMQGNATDAPLVDSHAHVYATDMPLSATAWHHPPQDATIEQYIATLDQHGVRYAVMAAAGLYDDYNEYMIASTVKYKHRLRTTAIVKPSIDLTSCARWKRAAPG